MIPHAAVGRSPAPPRGRLPRGLSAFRHRNYRLYFAGQLVSVTGTWIQTLAQSWLILSLTSSPVMLGLVNVCQFAPVLLLGLFGGVAADRFPRRTVLVVTQIAFALVSAVVAVLIWTGTIQLWHVFALALVLGLVNAFDMPSRQAFVVEMVGPDDLTNAIALNASLFNAARIVGPAVAGVLLATVGTAACFALDAVSYVVVIVVMLAMRLGDRPLAVAGSQLERLREGLAFVRRTPDIYLPTLLIGLVAAFGMNFSVWVPLLAKDDLGVGAGGFGLLMAALGCGSLVGALGIAFRQRLPAWGLVLAAALLLGVLEVVLGSGAERVPVPALLPVLAAAGLAMTTTSAMANTRIQSIAPDPLRGRVMSVYTTVFTGTSPFGALLAAAFAAGLGTPGSLVLCGLATAASAAAVAAIGRRVGVPVAFGAAFRRAQAEAAD